MSLVTARIRAAARMTPDEWLIVPVYMLLVCELTPTHSVSSTPCTTCTDPYIHVLQIGAVRYIEHGHHRVDRARRDHVDTIQARLLVIS